MTTSQNGWPVVEDPDRLAPLDWITGRVLPGDVHALFAHLCRRFHAEVEPITRGHSWGWAYRPVRGSTGGYSNHASGTAIDLNAPRHPLGRRGTFTPRQVARIRDILADLGGVIRWGGDYQNRADEMHFEINANRAAVHRAALQLANKGTMVVVAYNCKEGRGKRAAQDVARLVDAYAPHVLVLAETAGNRRALRRLLRGRYRVYSGTGWDGGSTWLAVRKGVKVRRFHLIWARRTWTGPKGRKRIGRALPMVVVRLGGRWVRLVGVHQVWSPRGRNKRAGSHLVNRLEAAAHVEGQPIGYFGDWNVTPRTKGDASAQRLAKTIGGEVIKTGAALDYGVVRGLRVTAKDGPKYGSDHPSAIYRIRVK